MNRILRDKSTSVLVAVLAVLAVFAVTIVCNTTEAHAAEYPVWVEGIQITDDNKDGVQTENVISNLNDRGIAETISFDPSTNTLHLETKQYSYTSAGNVYTSNLVIRIKQKHLAAGDTASGDGIDDGKFAAGIYAEDIDLTIDITGPCEIRNPLGTGLEEAERDAAIYVKNGSLNIQGDGYINIGRCTDKSRAIYTDGDFDMSGSLQIYAYLRGSSTEIRGIEAKNNINIHDGAYPYVMTDSYSNGNDVRHPRQYLFICGDTFTVSGAPVESEEYPWDPYTDPKYGTVYAQVADPGVNHDIGIRAQKLVIKDGATVQVKNTGTTTNAAFTGVDADVSLSDTSRLDIGARSQTNGSIGIIGNIDVSGSSVLRVADRTPDVGIQLYDQYSLRIADSARIEAYGSTYAIDWITETVFDYIKTIGASVNTAADASTSFDWDLETTFDNYKYAALPGYYPLWVSGTVVSGINKDDVLGDGTVSYDPETKTLTLNSASINIANSGPANDTVSGIYSQIP